VIGANGTLKPMNPATVAITGNPAGAIVDSTGRYLYVANSAGGVYAYVSQYTIGAGGQLTAISPPTAAAGPDIGAGLGESVAVDPTGSYVYVTTTVGAIGDYLGNLVCQFTIGSGGALTSIGTETTGGSVGTVVVDPSSRYVNVANGLYFGAGINAVSEYAVGSGGTLTAIGTVASGVNGASGLAVDPSDRYVYASNPQDNTISQYLIGTNGTLTPLTPATVPAGGLFPQAVAVDPSGTYVYVVTGTGSAVSVYTIGSGGALIPLGVTYTLVGP
jgi:DNA-binding beta-propeller fold protein YncE